MKIKYEDYIIERFDDRNLVLKKSVTRTASSKTNHHEKGEQYQTEAFRGYYPNVFAAMDGIVRDKAGEGCEDIQDVLKQCSSLIKSLKGLAS